MVYSELCQNLADITLCYARMTNLRDLSSAAQNVETEQIFKNPLAEPQLTAFDLVHTS